MADMSQNSNDNQIQKLPDELINQIAAGEVIERPASVVKELVDNSIDAGADFIKISLDNGGVNKIEISDNGSGISRDNLKLAFERHATSKIRSFEDLNNLISMGFRGEALSTIVSISKLTALSRVDTEDGSQIAFDNSLEGKITDAPRNVGTTITVENIFGNVPARQKFLKTAQTEFRKILEILYPYILLRSNIHFVIVRDGKEYLNVPAVKDSQNGVSLARAKQLLGSGFLDEAIEVFYDGSGTVISGFIAHPSYHTSRPVDQYIFINNRPVTDKGIYRAIHQGYSRFIPQGDKVPFIVSIKLNPDLVDVNVHPRKEEVRFANPYRVFSAVEESVKKALEKQTKSGLVERFEPVLSTSHRNSDNDYNRLRGGSETNHYDSGDTFANDMAGLAPQNANPFNSRSDVYNDRLFDSTITGEDFTLDKGVYESNLSARLDREVVNVFQMFNKYIFVEFQTEYWVIDQHAAAERISYERLLASLGDQPADIQELLVANDLQFSKSELVYLEENRAFFEELGFRYTVGDSAISVSAIPTEYMGTDLNTVFSAIFTDLTDTERNLKENSQKARQDILATIACHTSIRSKQKLQPEESKSIVNQLLTCQNPYSCPHGRPIVWKQALTQLDSNFDRTY